MYYESGLISVVIPFYKGNAYIPALLDNLEQVRCALTECGAQLEVIIVNDSPQIPVQYTAPAQLPVTVLQNPVNMGIQASRIHGIRHARGEWIQLLDQDDLLCAQHYPSHFRAAAGADVVVSNCYYEFGPSRKLLYANRKVMQYLITQKRFLQIRNLIASPGHCLIRHAAIADVWLENPLQNNGSDDYFLWLLLFHNGATFHLNDAPVYVHRNSAEGNLSFDLDKMHRSNLEMCRLLKERCAYPAEKHDALLRSIVFKYHFDTHTLKPLDWLRYCDKVLANAVYKLKTALLKH